MNIKDYENVLWNSIEDDLKAMVNIAERKPKTTKDHYGEYLHLLTNLKSQIGLDIARSLLIKAGGNENGINSACRIITGN